MHPDFAFKLVAWIGCRVGYANLNYFTPFKRGTLQQHDRVVASNRPLHIDVRKIVVGPRGISQASRAYI